ncbi:hypothetical protein VTK26DRAFT_6235 [Humicola hyalothermophila]
MVSFRSLLLTATGVLALPSGPDQLKNGQFLGRDTTPNSEGVHDGYFYSFWSDGEGTVNYQNGDKGNYNVTWQECGNFYGGKGWNPGEARTINFNGTFTTSGNGYLSIYGRTVNPDAEYYIIEALGTYDPSDYLNPLGSYGADGSEYKLSNYTRISWPSVILYQYYAVRQNKRTSGSIDIASHFAAWREKGVMLGQHNFQILAVEGYRSSGEADMTVWEGN